MSTYTKTSEIIEAVHFTGSNMDEVAEFIERGGKHDAVLGFRTNRVGYYEIGDGCCVTWIDPTEWVTRSTYLTTYTDEQFTARYTHIVKESA